MYYGTSPTGPYPGYGVTPNTPFQLNASSGQTIYFYYTYSVPEGGERNSSASKHSFVVGNCGSSSRIINDQVNSAEPIDLTLYPNPAQDIIHLNLSGKSFELAQLIDISGRVLLSEPVTEEVLTLDISDLLPGHYFLKVTGGNLTETRRFLKVR